MLKDQTFTKPFTICVNHELFYDRTVRFHKIDFERTAYFKHQIAGRPSGYVFAYVGWVEPSFTEDEHRHYLECLSAFGIEYQTFSFFDSLDPKIKRLMGGYLASMDLVYAPMLRTDSRVSRRSNFASAHLTPQGFLESLSTMIGSVSPYSLELFRQISND